MYDPLHALVARASRLQPQGPVHEGYEGKCVYIYTCNCALSPTHTILPVLVILISKSSQVKGTKFNNNQRRRVNLGLWPVYLHTDFTCFNRSGDPVRLFP